jgi:predicted transcriptional regulator
MPKDAKDIKQMFLQKKPCSILLAIPGLEKPYVSLLMKEADTTFAHTTNILSEMEAYGLIKFASEGRTKYVKLTVTGKDLVKSLRSVDSLLDGKSVIKKLKSLERRLDRLQEDVKSGRQDEMATASRAKKLTAIIERTDELEAEGSRYNNEAISLAIARAKERLEYLKTKVQPQETIPQDTLKPWLDNN